jgi:hypothetical protein
LRSSLKTASKPNQARASGPQTWEQKMTKPIVGQKIKLSVYGALQTVTVLAVHKFGTIDVETASGNCFRITGLSFI